MQYPNYVTGKCLKNYACAADGAIHAVFLRKPLPESEARTAGGRAPVRALVQLPRSSCKSGVLTAAA